MLVDFLTAEQEARYSRYYGDPTKAQLARYFYLHATDRAQVRNEPPRPQAELYGCDGVLTGCDLAIAQAGSIVLGPQQGRRSLLLVLGVHLCTVLVEHVVGSAPEGVGRPISEACDAPARLDLRPLVLDDN